MTAVALETYELTKRFGAFTAMADVSLKVRPGTVHDYVGGLADLANVLQVRCA